MFSFYFILISIAGISLLTLSAYSRKPPKGFFNWGILLLYFGVISNLIALALGAQQGSATLFPAPTEESSAYLVRVYLGYFFFFIFIVYLLINSWILRSRKKTTDSAFFLLGLGLIVICGIPFLGIRKPDMRFAGNFRYLSTALHPSVIRGILFGKPVNEIEIEIKYPWCPFYLKGENERAMEVLKIKIAKEADCESLNTLALLYEKKGSREDAFGVLQQKTYLGEYCIYSIVNFVARNRMDSQIDPVSQKFCRNINECNKLFEKARSIHSSLNLNKSLLLENDSDKLQLLATNEICGYYQESLKLIHNSK